MKIVKTDIFKYPCDAVCITTNGEIKKNGRAVMGAGVARSFRDKIKDIDLVFSYSLKQHGNVCRIFHKIGKVNIIAFPTKTLWQGHSDINLIRKSAKELNQLIIDNNLNTVLLPKPGCSNGGLIWNDVAKVLDEELHEHFENNRVIIVYE
ncbi:hypothetical protein [Providencia phage PSTRCR_127]|nr:hypothetical protein [Providencia phage PSTRCR_127]